MFAKTTHNLIHMDAHAHANRDLVLVLLALFDALSMHSYINIVASQLGTFHGQSVDVKHGLTTEPQDGVWWMYPEERRTN